MTDDEQRIADLFTEQIKASWRRGMKGRGHIAWEMMENRAPIGGSYADALAQEAENEE